MKRITALILILLTVLALCGCGDSAEEKNGEKEEAVKSDAVKSVEEKIAAIGIVTSSREGLIKTAERAYNALSPEERNQVENREVLFEARRAFDKLPVLITEENFSQYFKIKFTLSNSEVAQYNGLTIGQSYDLTVEVIPVKTGGFDNVEFELKVTLPQYWHVSLSDPAYVKGKTIPESEYLDSNGKITDYKKYVEATTYYMNLSISLPNTGTFTETHSIAREYLTQQLKAQDFSYEVSFVRGHFVKNN